MRIGIERQAARVATNANPENIHNDNEKDGGDGLNQGMSSLQFITNNTLAPGDKRRRRSSKKRLSRWGSRRPSRRGSKAMHQSKLQRRKSRNFTVMLYVRELCTKVRLRVSLWFLVLFCFVLFCFVLFCFVFVLFCFVFVFVFVLFNL
jgi:hypothetical protein